MWHFVLYVHLVDVKVSISVSSDLVTYGDDYTLTCEIHTLQSKPTLTDPLLQRYLTVKWVDINDMPIESQGSLTVGELTGEFSRSLHFDPVSEGHDRLYTCVAMLNFSGFQSTAYSQYRLMLGKNIASAWTRNIVCEGEPLITHLLCFAFQILLYFS